MKQESYLAPLPSLLLLVLACGEGGRAPTVLVGVEPSDAALPRTADPETNTDTAVAAPSPVATPPRAVMDSDEGFSVSIRNALGASVTSVSLPCGGSECLEVEAITVGGTPPLQLRWEDGSTATKRRLCPISSAKYSVTVTDTAVQAAEFGRDARTRTAELALEVAACVPDAGVAPVLPASACIAPDTGPRCDLGMGNVLPEDVTVDLFAEPRYFAKGAALPAGRYRIAYVDGCNTYGLGVGWVVHGVIAAADAVSAAVFGVYLVNGDGQGVLQPPGTEYWPAMGDGEASSYKQCVAFNCKRPPIDFDFPGGKLGLVRDGGGPLGAIDDDGGESQGGRPPTFRLIRLGACQGS